MSLLRKIHHLLGRRARLRRLEEEMRTHVELLTEEGVRAGLAPVEARRRAHLAFGNALVTREATEESLGWPVLESWWQDLRLAWRSLLRRPAFTASLVAILALGIGATGAIASLMRVVVFAPLPVPQPGEIHLVQAPEGGPQLLSAPTLQRLAADPAFHGGIAGYSDPTGVALRLGDKPAEPATAQFVTADFFGTLRLAPAQGRLLGPADDRLGESAAVAVVSWDFWQRQLGGDLAAVGRTLRLNGSEVTIVGIAPRRFHGVSFGYGCDFWLPHGLHAQLRASPSCWAITEGGRGSLADWVHDDCFSWLYLLLRLPAAERAGAAGSLAAAWQPHAARIATILRDPEERANYTARAPRIVPAPQGYSSEREGFRRVGLTLSLLVGAMVLVTAANSATLLLLRMLARTRELGVRLALGAGRSRLAREALMEGLVLSAAGVVAGLVLAWWLTPLLAKWLAPAAVDDVAGIDVPLVGLLAGLAVLLGLVLGAAPAWFGARLAPQAALQRQEAGPRGSLRLGRGLIVFQLALSVVLIAVAGALARDLRRTLKANYGYSRDSVLTVRFDLDFAGIEEARQPAVLERLRAAARELPQVRSVGFAASGALSDSRSSSRIYFRGEGVQQPGDSTQHESSDPEYFEVMGIPLLQGRGFAATDTAKSPRVAVLGQRLARAAFGEADPIGRRFGFGPVADAEEDWEIVGVVADARVNAVHEEPPAMFYTPLTQWELPPAYLAVRVAGDAAVVRKALAAKVTAAEPTLLFNRWLTLQERIERGVHDDMVAMRLTAGFGLLATLLAGIGVFGALGYLVSTRSRDIAVRLAVGADPGRVWRGVVGEALWLGLLGAAGGSLLTVLLPLWLGAWLMADLRLDWLAVSGAVAVGLLAALLGGLLPARRAARIDPLALLRAE